MRFAKCWQYQLPCVDKVFGRNFADIRKGLIVKLVDGNFSGYGEIAPLEGFSAESFDECLKITLTQLKRWQNHQDLQISILEKDFPSVAFGLSVASNQNFVKIPIKTTPKFAQIFCNQDVLNISNLKIKVGVDLSKEIKQIKQIIKQNPNISLRLDANRAWSLDLAMEFYKNLTKTEISKIEFIEEPCKTWADSERFATQTNLKIAIDESLRENGFQLPINTQTKAVVIKPTMTGSIEKCQQIISCAKDQNLKVILSSSFESSLGLHHIAKLSQICGLIEPLGIGSENIFAQKLVVALNGDIATPPESSKFCKELKI